MPDENGFAIWSDFPEFQSNLAIQSLAGQSRWSVSANLDAKSKGKAPIDLKNLFYGNGGIRGAFAVNDTCLVTLDELNENLPNAANNAFYLSAGTDGMLVLDIEPTCPAEIRDKLLALPSYYAEFSMSGRGYHLLMPLPANFRDFPVAVGKQKLQEEHRWFEILIDHWVTFTRRPVPGRRNAALDALTEGPRAAGPGDDVTEVAESSGTCATGGGVPDPLWTWENVWAMLASEAVESTKIDFDLDEDAPDLPFSDVIVDFVVRNRPTKPVEDFNGDLSRWEFSAMGHMYNTLSNVMKASNIQRARDWSDSDRAWLLYRAATEVLPYRPKHDEVRNGMPFLLYTAHTLIARRLGDS